MLSLSYLQHHETAPPTFPTAVRPVNLLVPVLMTRFAALVAVSLPTSPVLTLTEMRIKSMRPSWQPMAATPGELVWRTWRQKCSLYLYDVISLASFPGHSQLFKVSQEKQEDLVDKIMWHGYVGRQAVWRRRRCYTYLQERLCTVSFELAWAFVQ